MIEDVNIEAAAGMADAFRADPEHVDERRPGVLMLMDVFGLRPRLREMAATYAERGYRVLVPNLFYRQGRAPFADPMASLRAHAPEMYTADAASWLDALETPKVLVVGYCLGGAVALRIAAAHASRIAGVASFHAGRLATDDPASPHRLAPALKCPLHIVHADHDESMPPDQQARLAHALDEAHLKYSARVYPGCRHGFTMSDRDVFDPAGCDRHWREVFEFFEGVQR